jgi:hypothetical protein
MGTLIITNPADVHADPVIRHLYQMGTEVARWHPSDLSTDCQVKLSNDGWQLDIHSSGKTVTFNSFSTCWYRRPEPVRIGESIGPVDRTITSQESAAFLYGLYGCTAATWFSHPYYLECARQKPFQLRVAQAVGLNVPPYLLSNDPTALCEFAARCGDVVIKTINDRTTSFEIDGQWLNLLVKRFASADIIPILRSRPSSPCFLQQYVRKRHDARVTVIGTDIFAASVRPRDGLEVVDWRENILDHQYVTIDCPDAVKNPILCYLKSMSLNYGAFDFSVDTDGCWWFLECNPNGQWLWIEVKTGMPIAQTIADYLAGRRASLVPSNPYLAGAYTSKHSTHTT